MMVSSHLILALFLAAQAFDGLFTYTAVRADGLQAEGNIILATWMALIGPAPALFGAKLLATACGVLLYKHGVHRTLALLTALYAVAAVGPWIVLIRQY
jgi:Domain of unknown function (DUF5658)